ncbi:MAG TPA: hypothetical protein VLM91_05330 [Candidatus Methylomirabilis sp.]|nr:hypothetical protein [Candidatus Methylomirabilis sp.]
MFEHSTQPVISTWRFVARLARSSGIALSLIGVSLLIGMVGYHALEGFGWIDAFLNASMLLGGMGPVNAPASYGGKLFAGLYALYCGLIVIVVAGVLLAPVAHRLLHKFHVRRSQVMSGEHLGGMAAHQSNAGNPPAPQERS